MNQFNRQFLFDRYPEGCVSLVNRFIIEIEMCRLSFPVSD